MKRLVYISLLLACSICASAQRWQSSQPFHSEMLEMDLPYAVVLPADYDAQPEKRYPVMLFKSQIPTESTHMYANAVRKEG